MVTVTPPPVGGNEVAVPVLFLVVARLGVALAGYGLLVRTALLVCGDCEMASQFRIGVDLMIRGLDAYLQPLEEDTAAAR
jgi:hypothetical protein